MTSPCFIVLTIGQVLQAVDQSGAASNTLVIVNSDNRPATYVGVDPEQLKELKAQGFNSKEAERA